MFWSCFFCQEHLYYVQSFGATNMNNSFMSDFIEIHSRLLEFRSSGIFSIACFQSQMLQTCWKALKLSSVLCSFCVHPQTRWSKGRSGCTRESVLLSRLTSLGLEVIRPTQSLASSPVTDRITLNHLHSRGVITFSGRCNRKPYADVGNVLRVENGWIPAWFYMETCDTVLTRSSPVSMFCVFPCISVA